MGGFIKAVVAVVASVLILFWGLNYLENDQAPTERPDPGPDKMFTAEPMEHPPAHGEPGHDHSTMHDPPKPKPTPVAPHVNTVLVTRVIDGDTIELENGDDVRLLGIDTPERGKCGYDVATQNMIDMVEGKEVILVKAGQDKDYYGRLLRYVLVGNGDDYAYDGDVGLQQIEDGLAIARYDSRDGYPRHPQQEEYIKADAATPNLCPTN